MTDNQKNGNKNKLLSFFTIIFTILFLIFVFLGIQNTEAYVGWYLPYGTIYSSKYSSKLTTYFLIAFASLIAGILIEILNRNITRKNSLEDKIINGKKCIYCANIIKEEAVVCQFCHRDLPKDLKKTEIGVDTGENNVSVGGDWVCKKCNNICRKTALFCNTCGEKRAQ